MSSDRTPQADQALKLLKKRLGEASDSLVPWFFSNMPDYYFRSHSQEEQILHLQAILATEMESGKQAVVLKSPCGTRLTFIGPGGDNAGAVAALTQLSGEEIHTARFYVSHDRTLRLDSFILAAGHESCDIGGNAFARAMEQVRGGAISDEIPEDIEGFERFLASASKDYLDRFEPGRALRHYRTCGCLDGVEGVQVELEPGALPGDDRITVAMANPPRRGLLLHAFKVFMRENVPVRRAYADLFDGPDGSTRCVLSFYICREEETLDPGGERFARLKRQLKSIKWFAFHGLERLAEEDGYELRQVMLMQAAGEFAHQFLIRKNLYAYTSGRIVHTLLKHRQTTRNLFDYFDARFNPAHAEGREELVEARRTAVHKDLQDVRDDIERRILGYVLRFFRYTLRTNYYLPRITGLSFRLDPAILRPMPQEQWPYGFYCFHGPYCFGFHVRYRDMARGGVRVVRTKSQEQFELESNRLFDEATKLAQAQQFKNKDIPEGGSKAVILLGPDGEVDLAVKSMVDSFLDLLVGVDGRPVPPEVVDYLGREEIIYLGPDENITGAHVQWMVDRAARRGYRWPAAFMSSKPRAGIAHKQYGVTSEGVVVFAEEVLRTLGIDPRNQPFSVKLTGGPAGDVASNAMRILIREYGDNARILSMSDGHGAAYDPEGLDHGELLRLIDQGGRAHQFDEGLLRGAGAFVAGADTREGARQRDELHNRVRADIFIPCGGRPDTMNTRNWTSFLAADGTPSAKAMVEGANIFISPEAREKLESRGVVCVPGSSANKTGVICSSYEILAGLALSEDEFLEIKDEYVAQLLDILRARARDEARLLLREWKLGAGRRGVTSLSFELSSSINTLSDAIVENLSSEVASVRDDPELCDLILAYCPAVLATRYGDRILDRVPRAHQLALLSAFIASRMLYNEGLGWVDSLTASRSVHDVVDAYLAEEKRVAQLVRTVRESGLDAEGVIADILDASGRKHLVLRHLGLA